MAIVTGLAYCNSVQYQTKRGSPEKNTHNMLQQREEFSGFIKIGRICNAQKDRVMADGSYSYDWAITMDRGDR